MTNSAGYTCEWYYQDGYEAECPYLNTDTFDAYTLCCVCGGGSTSATDEEQEKWYAAEYDQCGYYDDVLGYDITCQEGLTCQDY